MDIAMEAFDILRDQEDNLSVEKVGEALRAIGFNPTDAEVMDLVNKFDTNADGEISKAEWEEMVKDMDQFPKDNEEDIKNAFAVVAKGDPTISTAELTFIMTTLGTQLDESEAQAMVKTVDANGDGSVDWTEFTVMLKNPNA